MPRAARHTIPDAHTSYVSVCPIRLHIYASHMSRAACHTTPEGARAYLIRYGMLNTLAYAHIPEGAAYSDVPRGTDRSFDTCVLLLI